VKASLLKAHIKEQQPKPSQKANPLILTHSPAYSLTTDPDQSRNLIDFILDQPRDQKVFQFLLLLNSSPLWEFNFQT